MSSESLQMHVFCSTPEILLVLSLCTILLKQLCECQLHPERSGRQRQMLPLSDEIRAHKTGPRLPYSYSGSIVLIGAAWIQSLNLQRVG